MKISFPHRKSGFTLIELIVVVAILAVLVGIAAPAIYNNINAGDIVKCRSNLEHLSRLGVQYGQDRAHSHLLPTSGMSDDKDTKNFNEREGWWISLASADDTAVMPDQRKAKLKLSLSYHCPSDNRFRPTDNKMEAHERSVSYVSWTDGSENPRNPNSAIRTTGRKNLDVLPWLSDGNPIKNKSVNNFASFKKMVWPARERHQNTIMVLYASGLIKGIKVGDEDSAPQAIFHRIAPNFSVKGSHRAQRNFDTRKSGKKAASPTTTPADDSDDADDEEEEDTDTEDDVDTEDEAGDGSEEETTEAEEAGADDDDAED